MPLPADIALKTIDGKRGGARRFRGQGAADRQRRQPVRVYTPIHRTGGALPQAQPRASPARFSLRPVRASGAGRRPEINSFCSLDYDVTFPMFAKIEVNGPIAHPIYRVPQTRTTRHPRQVRASSGTSPSSWSTGKRRVVRRYAPSDKPETLAEDIQTALG